MTHALSNDATTTPVSPKSANGGWGWSLTLGIALALIYLVNRADPIGSEDTAPNSILSVAILRGDGVFLDRFAPILTDSGRMRLHWTLKRFRGHIVSRYSIGPALVNLPIVAVQLAIVDRIDPGWDRNPGLAFLRSSRMSKVASGLIAALTAVLLHRLLRRLVAGAPAVLATIAAAVGSEMWMIGSQAPWEHGSAVFMLTSSLLLLTPRNPSRLALLIAGATTAMIVVCRPIDLVFALALLLRVAWGKPRDLLWFLPGSLVLGVALLAYNLYFFDSLAGGHAELEALHPTLHNLDGAWSGRLLDGLLGTLWSPNRGLFVFCPWIVIALATLPATAARLRAWPLAVWMGGALLVDLLILSKYAVWWGGHSFGPRYWTDATPIFAVLFAFSLDWALVRCRPIVGVSFVTVLFAVVLQAIGAFCAPSSWNPSPIDVDRAPRRVWDWSDTEIRRCLREGVKPWASIDDPLWRFGHRPR